VRRAPIRLERRGRAALEDVEAVDVVGLPDVHAGTDVPVVRPAAALRVERVTDRQLHAERSSVRLSCQTEELGVVDVGAVGRVLVAAVSRARQKRP
jgi:hypothetical protein